MSRAFVKEDVEMPERATQRRGASGLPPGTQNLMTADGAQLLRGRLAEWRRNRTSQEDISALEETLAGATIVNVQPRTDAIIFGSRVTLRTADGRLSTYRIVGVDEEDLEPGNVSWMSPLGQALLAAEPGKSVRIAGSSHVVGTVVQVG